MSNDLRQADKKSTEHSTWLAFFLLLPCCLLAACATSSPSRTAPIPKAVEVHGKIEPPVLVYKEPAEYTEEAHKARIQGVVIARLIIDTDGQVASVSAQKRLPMGLTQKAIEALWLYRYEPATLEGQPIAVYREETVTFRLTGNSFRVFGR